ncbi:hypothetical protein IWQ62_000214 [Dispira parvispora]|uniref:Uncharacterized protein n=1 Tax=Dispira parvispora TaxID=1520584 RepID=A0A9W8AXF1_9FUNG|nr:hypothetical protein IWQ62_000214 [Dispira parvispora]
MLSLILVISTLLLLLSPTQASPAIDIRNPFSNWAKSDSTKLAKNNEQLSNEWSAYQENVYSSSEGSIESSSTSLGSTDTSDFETGLPKECRKLLMMMYDKHRKVMLDAYAKAVLGQEEHIQDYTDAFLQSFGDLTMEQKLGYITNEVNQWMYLIHKDYHQTQSGKEGAKVEEHYHLTEEWLNATPFTIYKNPGDTTTLDEHQRKSIFIFPKDQYRLVKQPLQDSDFSVKWVDLHRTSDYYLITQAPLLFAIKHNRLNIVNLILQQISMELLNQDSREVFRRTYLEKFAKAYPIYFNDQLNVFGSQSEYMNTVFASNFSSLKGMLVFSLIALESLKNPSDSQLWQLLSPRDSSLSNKIFYGSRALQLYALAREFPNIIPPLKKFIKQLARRDIQLNVKALKEIDAGYTIPRVKFIKNVYKVSHGQIKVALVDLQ